jgi:sec-independent protein translocase protein TatA
MFGLGMQEVLVLCALGLLLFGRKLPDLARSLGKTVAVFQSEVQGAEEAIRKTLP